MWRCLYRFRREGRTVACGLWFPCLYQHYSASTCRKLNTHFTPFSERGKLRFDAREMLCRFKNA